MLRLGKVLEGHDGLEAANANLIGEVSLIWDDEQTSREELLEAMARGGFRELPRDTETVLHGWAYRTRTTVREKHILLPEES